MKRPAKNLLLAAFGLLIVGSLAAWIGTGMRGYTRFRDAAVEEANRHAELGNLFTAAGGSELPAVESTNAIGLLPSGPGLASVSVLTLGGAGAAGIGMTLWLDRKRNK